MHFWRKIINKRLFVVQLKLLIGAQNIFSKIMENVLIRMRDCTIISKEHTQIRDNFVT